VVTTIGNVGYDPALTELLPQWLAIVPFVQSQAFRTPPSVADFDAIDRFQDVPLVMPVGFAQREVERMTVGIHDQVAFEAGNTVFSRVAYLIFAPFFDFTTLASW